MYPFKNQFILPNCYDTINPNETDNLGRVDTTDMSLIIGLIGKDGIVLASDSRLTTVTSSGNGKTHSDDFIKLWAIGKIGIAGCGNYAGYETEIVDRFRKSYIENDNFDKLVDTFIECVTIDLSKTLNSIFMPKENRNPRPPELVFILASYQDGIPTMKYLEWNLAQPIPVIRKSQRGYYSSGLWTITDYWIKKFKNSIPFMGIESLKKFASFLICESTYFDGVGTPLQMITIQNIGIKPIPESNLAQLEIDAKRIMDEEVDRLISEFEENRNA
ncbi:MAG: hypothetical protein PHY28_03685 [Dehalococcoidales bacterium]|nr:hypothetical protein [Dehalococcoidales bacterium]